MKASLKFREDQKPLLKAKVPLNILDIPFQSGVVSGESKELTLNLATFFQSGPSIKFSYRPNDSGNPFSLILKTGTGSFGSPVSSSVVMSCEFNLHTRNGSGNLSPVFMLHFKPRSGGCGVKTTSGIAFQKSPFLVMDKIGVELLSGGDSKKVAAEVGSPVNGNVAEEYLTVKKQLEVLRGENGMLRNAVEDLRQEIGGRGLELGKYRDFERNEKKLTDAIRVKN
ncbi:unnamed protein product [Lupinus luteus]|uniref:Uncharacterized protein n=1 Tax=Lupinus luteus TaxID=3873 RepID=A0AAV1YDT4_LUPLU